MRTYKKLFIIFFLFFYFNQCFGNNNFGVIVNTEGETLEKKKDIDEKADTGKVSDKNNPAIDKYIGIGIIVGEPTGLSFKVDITNVNFVDIAVGFSFYDDKYLNIHGDYLFKYYKLLEIPEMDTAPYFGIGARITTQKRKNIGNDSYELSLGGRVPVGILMQLQKYPVEFFLEGALTIDIIPIFDAGFNLFIGGRYCF